MTTKTIKVRNMLNYQPQNGRTMKQKGETQPNRSMSVRQILEKHVQGVPVGSAFTEHSDEQPENQIGIDPRKLDLVDIHELAKQNFERMVNMAKEEKDKHAKRKQEKEAAELEKITKAAEQLLQNREKPAEK